MDARMFDEATATTGRVSFGVNAESGRARATKYDDKLIIDHREKTNRFGGYLCTGNDTIPRGGALILVWAQTKLSAVLHLKGADVRSSNTGASACHEYGEN